MFIPIIYMGMIFLLSSVPSNRDQDAHGVLNKVNPYVQNMLHIPIYGALVWLWFTALSKFKNSRRAALWTAILISLSYGILDEAHQYFVPGRYTSIQDIAFNFAGVGLASLGLMMRREDLDRL